MENFDEKVLELIKQRRSTRSYKSELPKKEDIAAVVEAGRYAPSAMNEQSRTFTVITNPDILRALDSVVNKLGGSESCTYHAPCLILVSAPTTLLYAEQDCACSLENMFLMAQAKGLGTCWINQFRPHRYAENSKKILFEVLESAGVPSGEHVFGACALGFIAADTALKPRTDKTIWN